MFERPDVDSVTASLPTLPPEQENFYTVEGCPAYTLGRCLVTHV